ncbi:MAG: MFS transporter [Firmicutes bacterium]|nr:MFS transporter [Bacillota bacterium]
METPHLKGQTPKSSSNLRSLATRQIQRCREMLQTPGANARALILAEPFWGTVTSWYALYGPLYMVALGVSKSQVGLITAIGLTVQVISALLGGHLADHWGRKRTMQLADVIGWAIPSIIWLTARSMPHFLIAAAINGLYHAAIPAWSCLLVEDTHPSKRQAVYAIVQMMFVGSGLLVPIGGLFIQRWGIVEGARTMYLAGLFIVIIALFIRQRGVRESAIGANMVEETIAASPAETLGEFYGSFQVMRQSPTILVLFLVQTISMFTTVIRNTYGALYMTDTAGLGLSPAIIALIPAATSGTMILALLLLVPHLGPQHTGWGLQVGALCFTLGTLALLAAPPGLMVFPLISALFNGLGSAILEPIRQASLANAIPDRARAKINSLIAVLTLAATIPAGPLAGALYSSSPHLPFVLAIALQIISQILLLWLVAKGKLEQQAYDEDK